MNPGKLHGLDLDKPCHESMQTQILFSTRFELLGNYLVFYEEYLCSYDFFIWICFSFWCPRVKFVLVCTTA